MSADVTAGRVIRVLIVQGFFPSFRYAFFRALSDQRDLHVELACGAAPSDSGVDVASDPSGVRVVGLRNYFIGRPSRFSFQLGALRAARTARPDVVICEFNLRTISSLLLWARCRATRTPFVWWGHGFGGSSRSVVRSLRAALARHSSGIICYSDRGAKELILAGASPARVRVAQNSIDVGSIRPLRRSWRFEERHRLTFVGRLVEGKKVHELIEAFALISGSLPPSLRLTIVGDGPSASDLRERVRRHGLHDRVEFLGGIHDERELAEVMNTSLFTLSAGYLGLSIVHSFSYGLPILYVAGEPHAPEACALRSGDNSWALEHGDPSALATGIRSLVEDPGRLQRMSAGALETVEADYGVEPMVRTFLEAIRSAVRPAGEVRPRA